MDSAVALLFAGVLIVWVVSSSAAHDAGAPGDSRTRFPGIPSTAGTLAACWDVQTRVMRIVET